MRPPPKATPIRRLDRVLEIQRDAREIRGRLVHQLEQLRARLLLRRIDILIALDDIDIDAPASRSLRVALGDVR